MDDNSKRTIYLGDERLVLTPGMWQAIEQMGGLLEPFHLRGEARTTMTPKTATGLRSRDLITYRTAYGRVLATFTERGLAAFGALRRYQPGQRRPRSAPQPGQGGQQQHAADEQ